MEQATRGPSRRFGFTFALRSRRPFWHAVNDWHILEKQFTSSHILTVLSLTVKRIYWYKPASTDPDGAEQLQQNSEARRTWPPQHSITPWYTLWHQELIINNEQPGENKGPEGFVDGNKWIRKSVILSWVQRPEVRVQRLTSSVICRSWLVNSRWINLNTGPKKYWLKKIKVLILGNVDYCETWPKAQHSKGGVEEHGFSSRLIPSSSGSVAAPREALSINIDHNRSREWW